MNKKLLLTAVILALTAGCNAAKEEPGPVMSMTPPPQAMSPEEQWWLERLVDGRIAAGASSWETDISKDRVQGDYLAYCERQRIFRRQSPVALGRFLARILPEGYPTTTQRTVDIERQDAYGTVTSVRERTAFYTFPSLEDCRRAWEDKFGRFRWPEDAVEATGPDPY